MYKRVLVPIDGSVISNVGLEEAAKLAKLCGANLRLIHVVDPTVYITGYETLGPRTEQDTAAMAAAGQDLLDDGKGRAATKGVVNVDTVLIEHSAARISERIVEHAKSWGADLIVMGTHGRRGMGRVLLGSDAEQTARIAPVPVMLVRVPDYTAGR